MSAIHSPLSCYLWHGIRTYRNILYKLLLSITGLQFYIFDSPITKPDQLVFCISATLHLLTILFSRMHSWIFRPSLVLLALPKSVTNSCRILSLFVNLRHDKGRMAWSTSIIGTAITPVASGTWLQRTCGAWADFMTHVKCCNGLLTHNFGFGFWSSFFASILHKNLN